MPTLSATCIEQLRAVCHTITNVGGRYAQGAFSPKRQSQSGDNVKTVFVHRQHTQFTVHTSVILSTAAYQVLAKVQQVAYF